MKRLLLLALTAGLLSPIVGVKNVYSESIINNEIIDKCLPAVDFEGCVRVLSEAERNNIGDDVKYNKDILGIEKIPGWKLIEDYARNEVLYINERGVKKSRLEVFLDVT